MSKSTNRYGKVLYEIKTSIDAEPVLIPESLIRNWKMLDKYSLKEYNKPYDSLTDKQKSALHLNINTGVYEDRSHS